MFWYINQEKALNLSCFLKKYPIAKELEGKWWKKDFYYLYILGNTIILETDDEFSIKKETNAY